MLAALWAYDGWNNMPMAAGEVQNPGRNIPRALIVGMIVIIAIYCLANLAYFYALPFGEVVTSNSTAHREALPVYQVKEFWPTITIGGSVFSPGFLAMLLADNWTSLQTTMDDWERMALFYAGTRGMNRGSVRVLPGCDWVITGRFIPDVKAALAEDGIALAQEPTFFFINRIQVFRQLFTRELTEDEILQEAREQQRPTLERTDPAESPAASDEGKGAELSLARV